MNRNETLFERAKKIIPAGVNSPVRAFGSVGGTPRFIRRAQGPFVWDENGTQYIDFVGSWGTGIVGHAHPEVVEAVREAAMDGLSFGAPTEAEILIAEEIAKIVPSVERLRLLLPRPLRQPAGQSRFRPAHLRQSQLRRRSRRFDATHHRPAV